MIKSSVLLIAIFVGSVAWRVPSDAQTPNAPQNHLPGVASTKPDFRSDSCYQEPEHDASDLCAQWRAAIAAEQAAERALWSNIISGAAALLSFVGTLAVILALKAARDANRIARDTALADNRPWIQIKNVKLADWSLSPSNDGITRFCGTVVYEIENTGKSPARLGSRGMNGSNLSREEERRERTEFLQRTRDEPQGTYLAPNASIREWGVFFCRPSDTGSIPGDLNVQIDVAVQYTDASASRRMETAVTGNIGQKQPDLPWIENNTPLGITMASLNGVDPTLISVMNIRTIKTT